VVLGWVVVWLMGGRVNALLFRSIDFESLWNATLCRCLCYRAGLIAEVLVIPSQAKAQAGCSLNSTSLSPSPPRPLSLPPLKIRLPRMTLTLLPSLSLSHPKNEQARPTCKWWAP
jgi:hypothetical protein